MRSILENVQKRLFNAPISEHFVARAAAFAAEGVTSCTGVFILLHAEPQRAYTRQVVEGIFYRFGDVSQILSMKQKSYTFKKNRWGVGCNGV